MDNKNLEKVDLKQRVADLIEEGYHFDFGAYTKRGFALFRSNLLSLVAFTSLQLLVTTFAINYLLGDQLGEITVASIQSMAPVNLLSIFLKYLAVQIFLASPFSAGLYYGISLACVGKPFISYADFFKGMKLYALPMMVVNFISMLIVLFGLLLIVPGIYFWIAYMLAPVFLVFGNAGVKFSLELSRKLVTRHWFSFLGLMLIYTLLNQLLFFVMPILVVILAPLFSCVLVAVFVDLIFGIDQE